MGAGGGDIGTRCKRAPAAKTMVTSLLCKTCESARLGQPQGQPVHYSLFIIHFSFLMITDINYNKFLRLLLPVRMRGVRMLAWLGALIAPVAGRLYPFFKRWEADSWYTLKYQSGQVAYLEKVLNDRFDAANQRIFIGPGFYAGKFVYLYRDAELPVAEEVFLYRDVEASGVVYLYQDAELGSGVGSYDFTVNVPAASGIGAKEMELRALTDRFKRDGKRYQVVYF